MLQENDYTIIGIDGGGTRTRGILYRNKKVIAQSNSGTTRIGTVGVGESCERILNIIADLCEQGGIDSAELDAVVVGLAGVWLEEEKMRSAHLLKTLARGQKIILNDLLVISDAELALDLDGSLMHFRGAGNDHESEPRSALSFGRKKRLKKFRLHFFGHPAGIVFHDQLIMLIILDPGMDPDTSVWLVLASIFF